VDLAQGFDHLHLNDDRAFDKQVQAVLTDDLSLVGHAHFDLGSDRDVLLLQFDDESPAIDCFAETSAKDLVNFDDRIDDRSRKRIVDALAALPPNLLPSPRSPIPFDGGNSKIERSLR
jgi:hypothetical protein